MSIFKKLFTRPVASPVKTESQKERDLIIHEESLVMSDLDEYHGDIVSAISAPDKWDKAESMFGDGWNVMFTLGKSISFVDRWLEDNALDIGQEACNLLYENRRNPFSEYARTSGVTKGNWHRYGRCPFVSGERKTYSKVVLLMWLEEYVRPQAKPIEDKAA